MTALAVIVNSVILALGRFPIDPQLELLMQQLNLGFYFFFLFELFIQLLGRGFRNYF